MMASWRRKLSLVLVACCAMTLVVALFWPVRPMQQARAATVPVGPLAGAVVGQAQGGGPGLNARSKQYDLAGNLIAETDEKGNATTHVYDARNRRVSTTDRLGNTTHWTYDATGNELSMTDAQGQTTGYAYDAAGRKTQTIWPDHVMGSSPGAALL